MTGRSTQARTMTVGTTISSTAITGPAGTFEKGDVGRTITGPGIPAGATIAAVAGPTAATLSVAATATGVSAVTLGQQAAETMGFRGWSPETEPESESYTVAAVNAGTVTPDRVTSPTMPRPPQRSR